MKSIIKKKNTQVKIFKFRDKKKDIASVSTKAFFSKTSGTFNKNFVIIGNGEAFIGVHEIQNLYQEIIIIYFWKKNKFVQVGNLRKYPIRHISFNNETNIIVENNKNKLLLHYLKIKKKNSITKEICKNVIYKFTKKDAEDLFSKIPNNSKKENDSKSENEKNNEIKNYLKNDSKIIAIKRFYGFINPFVSKYLISKKDGKNNISNIFQINEYSVLEMLKKKIIFINLQKSKIDQVMIERKPQKKVFFVDFFKRKQNESLFSLKEGKKNE